MMRKEEFIQILKDTFGIVQYENNTPYVVVQKDSFERTIDKIKDIVVEVGYTQSWGIKVVQ